MNAHITEKLALRRILQNYVQQLDEKIVTLIAEETSVPAPPLVFYDHYLIAWGEDSETFTPATYLLVRHLDQSPGKFLSKEDVRQDVIADETASEGALRQCISTARKELAAVQFPYRIETIRGKGYKLVDH
jgi:DNA-binding winged helix-turn-helix (wHTH) protein